MIENMKLLTVQEVALLLQVCQRTVMNMAKKGELPGKKLGRLWRFEEDSVLKWLENRGKSDVFAADLKKPATANIASAPALILPPINENLDKPLSEMFIRDSIRFTKRVADKREVFEILATLAFRTGYFGNYQSLVDSLIDREQMHPTAFEGGIAFPHPRRPLDILNNSLLAALIVEEGIFFGAPDGEPTKLFILICSPSDAGHVKILGRLAYIFGDRKNIKKLLSCKNPDEFLEKIKEQESQKYKSNNK